MFPCFPTETLQCNGSFADFVKPHHNKPCLSPSSQGYLLYSVKQKLKAELQGMPSNEIRERKLAGESVTDTIEVSHNKRCQNRVWFTNEGAAPMRGCLEALEDGRGELELCIYLCFGQLISQLTRLLPPGNFCRQVPEFAFTGDTTGEFIHNPENADVLAARVLVMELTFLDDNVSVEQARVRWHNRPCVFLVSLPPPPPPPLGGAA